MNLLEHVILFTKFLQPKQTGHRHFYNRLIRAGCLWRDILHTTVIVLKEEAHCMEANVDYTRIKTVRGQGIFAISGLCSLGCCDIAVRDFAHPEFMGSRGWHCKSVYLWRGSGVDSRGLCCFFILSFTSAIQHPEVCVCYFTALVFNRGCDACCKQVVERKFYRHFKFRVIPGCCMISAFELKFGLEIKSELTFILIVVCF